MKDFLAQFSRLTGGRIKESFAPLAIFFAGSAFGVLTVTFLTAGPGTRVTEMVVGSVSQPAAASEAAASVSGKTPCEKQGWPYVDPKCRNAATAPTEAVRQVRVIPIYQDQSASKEAASAKTASARVPPATVTVFSGFDYQTTSASPMFPTCARTQPTFPGCPRFHALE